MSWFFPPEPFIAGEVLDIDLLNLNFAAVQSEVGGELNEHNFGTNALVGAESKWDDAIGLRISTEAEEADPLDAAARHDIPVRTSWVPLEGSTHTHVSRGGDALVIASFQISNNPNAGVFDNPGLQFALEINGLVRYDGFIGSGDMTNDYISDAQNAMFTGTWNPALAGDTGPGIRAKYFPVVLEAVVFLPAGEHIIRVVSRNLRLSSDAAVAQYSSQCEVIVLEGWS